MAAKSREPEISMDELERIRNDPKGPAFRELIIDRYGTALLAQLRADLPDDLKGVLDPEDVLQESWSDVIRSLNQFVYGKHANLAAWLHTVVRRNLLDVIDFYRRTKRYQPGQGEQAASGDDEPSALDQVAQALESVSQELVRKERAEHFQRLLAELRPEHQEVLRLRYFEGLSFEEAARRVGCSKGAMLARQTRAFSDLRDRLRRSGLVSTWVFDRRPT
jgi:RNA polymerase sigma-70 factor (ECF subfamily)